MSMHSYDQCPSCGGPKRQPSRLCSACSCGRRSDANAAYALELGISRRRLNQLGGEAKLRALSPEACALLLRPKAHGELGLVRHGGLAGRGFLKGVPGRYRACMLESQREAPDAT